MYSSPCGIVFPRANTITYIRRELNSLPCFSGSRSVADAGTAHRCTVDDRPPMPLKVQICRYTVHIIHEREERMREAGRAFVG